MKTFTLISTLLLPAAAFCQATAQAIPPATPSAHSAAAQPVPQHVIYGQLFRHVLFLEKQADLADQRGLNGNDLRNFYQEHGRLSTAEAAALKQIARNAIDQTNAIDERIQAVILTAHAQYPGGRLPPNTLPPPPPQELYDLQNQKDNVMLTHTASLRAAMGEERFQAFDAYIQRDFAPHITIMTAGARAATGRPGQPLLPTPKR